MPVVNFPSVPVTTGIAAPRAITVALIGVDFAYEGVTAR